MREIIIIWWMFGGLASLCLCLARVLDDYQQVLLVCSEREREKVCVCGCEGQECCVRESERKCVCVCVRDKSVV